MGILQPQKNIALAAHIISKLNLQYSHIQRFPTGYCHSVYLVITSSDRYVLRISDLDAKPYYEGSVFWLPQMDGLGLPVPKIIQHGKIDENFYTMLTHIPGQDLGIVYAALSSAEKKAIASRLADYQACVSTLPPQNYYGYSLGEHDSCWQDVIVRLITRAKNRIVENNIFSSGYTDTLLSRMKLFTKYFDKVCPTPFLDDITTKNVLIHNGQLSGIVDIDEICCGDPFLTLGLTHMALLLNGEKTDYIQYWLTAARATQEQKYCELFYALVFCVDFMGEQGMSFANGVQVKLNEKKIAQLESIYHQLSIMLTS